MNKDKNCLLLVPSLMTRDTLITYTVEGEHESYEGRQTNEAVAKYLMKSLHDQGGRLSNMIMLCSTEVDSNVLEIAGGRTTYQYLKDEIGSFYKRVYSDDMPDDFFVHIAYKNEADTENMMAELQKVLGKEKENLYVDFTGGIRSAAMALVFICRIFNRKGVKTKKILYSNISKGGTGTIEDCTGTYNLFLWIEGDCGEYLKTIGKIKESEALLEAEKKTEMAEMNNDAKGYKSSLEEQQKRADEMVKGEGYLVGEVVRTWQGAQPKVSEQDNSQLFFLRSNLNKKNYSKALNTFRQTFVSKILPEENFIATKPGIREEELSDEVLAAYCYYENYNKEMKKFIQSLGEPANQSKNPRVMADMKFDENFYNLEKRPDNKRIKKFGLNDADSWDIAWKEIKPYINKQFQKTGNIEESFDLFKRLYRLYAISGYPFECVFKNKVFAGYAELYENIRKRGVDMLETLYKGEESKEVRVLFDALEVESCSYGELISKLNEKDNGWMLTKLFPFSFRPDYIGPGCALKQDWGAFSYQLAKSFSLVNKVRNKQTHNGSEVKDPEVRCAVEEVKKLVQSLPV